jgi:NADPH:quinone reductase
MRAVWYERTGPATEVLLAGEQPLPEPGPGEVRVRLAASGVNPADTYRRRGEGYSMEAPLVIPNSDGAGIIDKVGAGIDPDRIGERVWIYNGQRGRPLGTAAEAIALDADLVTRLPDDVGFEAGACLGIPCMTAHRCVFSDGASTGPARGFLTDKTVLVTGGGGAVGNYAIQLARWAGARVLATVSNDTHAADARAAGAELILDRHREDIRSALREATGGKGVDRIVEVDFGGNLEVIADSIAPNGTVAVYASRGNATPSVPIRTFMQRNVTIQTVVLNSAPMEARRRAQADITQWLREGQRLHRIAGLYPLERTAEAHLAVEAGAKRGTVVVTLS